MRIVITGGGGMLGQKLARALAQRERLGGRAITRLDLADVIEPAAISAPFAVARHRLDIADRAAVDGLFAGGVDAIFHLAAIPSAAAEADFDLGLRVNLIGTLTLLEAARALGTAPVFVFSSTIATYGGDVPEPTEDWYGLEPQTSYGAQKAAAEQLVHDFSRRGFVDGRSLRLPTISIRPGRPNGAASGFMSSIFREPLQGLEARCPVGLDYLHWYLSPRKCVENLVIGAELPAAAFGAHRSVALPGRSWTIGAMIEAMRRVAGDGPTKLIRFEPDPAIAGILAVWRGRFEPRKALAMGFVRDETFEDNIRYFLEDDLPKA